MTGLISNEVSLQRNDVAAVISGFIRVALVAVKGDVVELPLNRLAVSLEKSGVPLSSSNDWERLSTMNTTTEEYEDRDLVGIDVSKYAGVLTALNRLGVGPISIKPILAARELAVGEFAGTGICIGIGNDEGQVAGELNTIRVTSIRAVVHTSSLDEAALIRSDMERYFARHFPGRYQQRHAPFLGTIGSIVYVIFCEM